VREYKYIGYVMQRNEEQEAQIRDRMERTAAIMGQIWEIGKRRFGKDWARILWIFDSLVWTVIKYGIEIWE